MQDDVTSLVSVDSVTAAQADMLYGLGIVSMTIKPPSSVYDCHTIAYRFLFQCNALYGELLGKLPPNANMKTVKRQ